MVGGHLADDAHLVQDDVDIFAALIQQLSVEEGLVFDDGLAVEDHQVLEALGQCSPPFVVKRIAGIRA